MYAYKMKDRTTLLIIVVQVIPSIELFQTKAARWSEAILLWVKLQMFSHHQNLFHNALLKQNQLLQFILGLVQFLKNRFCLLQYICAPGRHTVNVIFDKS